MKKASRLLEWKPYQQRAVKTNDPLAFKLTSVKGHATDQMAAEVRDMQEDRDDNGQADAAATLAVETQESQHQKVMMEVHGSSPCARQ